VCVTENALAQAVAAVREALADAGTDAIACVRGRGYRFTLPVVERAAATVSVSAPAVPARSSSITARRLAESLVGSESFVVGKHQSARLERGLRRSGREDDAKHAADADDALHVDAAADTLDDGMEIDRPRPVPTPTVFVVKKRSKMWGSCSAGIPQPVSWSSTNAEPA
jgi:hypothetical protein